MKSFYAQVVLLVLSLGVSSCHAGAVKGSVSCLDCPAHYNLSGVRVRVECKDDTKATLLGTTVSSGAYEVKVPSSASGCAVELLGGPVRFYAYKKNMRVEVVNYKAMSNLEVYTKCPLSDKHYCESSSVGVGKAVIGSRKTVDLPLPREWGMAPSSYYINPFIPIIGIP